ncbi:MAG: hypothetical protein ACKVHQ_13065 [Gammaproteobacteria bacterium]
MNKVTLACALANTPSRHHTDTGVWLRFETPLHLIVPLGAVQQTLLLTHPLIKSRNNNKIPH